MCRRQHIFGVHADVPKNSNDELASLVAAEPPFTHPETPRYLNRYLSILGRYRPAAHNFGLIYELPQSLPYRSDARLIGSDSEEARDFMHSLSPTGLCAGLFELGFRHVADFWPPWCIAVVDGEIASIAFAARLGAELGLATAKAFRWARLRRSGDRWLVTASLASISHSFLQHEP